MKLILSIRSSFTPWNTGAFVVALVLGALNPLTYVADKITRQKTADTQLEAEVAKVQWKRSTDPDIAGLSTTTNGNISWSKTEGGPIGGECFVNTAGKQHRNQQGGIALLKVGEKSENAKKTAEYVVVLLPHSLDMERHRDAERELGARFRREIIFPTCKNQGNLGIGAI